MRRSPPLFRARKGFALVELVVVLAIIGALLAIALPHYALYRAKAQATACLAVRYQAQNAEAAHYLDTGAPGLAISDQYRCPAGGELVWIVSDPDQEGYPKLGCSVHHWPFAVETASKPLFSTPFDTMDNLSPLIGRWQIESGLLTTVGGGEQRLAFGDAAWQDYEVSVNATLSSGQGYGVYYRSDGAANITGYILQYDPGYGRGEFIVRKVVDGREQSPIQRVPIPDGFPVYNQSHQISVAVTGDRHQIRVDGETLLDFTDDSFSTGMAGLRTWGSSQVGFEDATVTATNGGS